MINNLKVIKKIGEGSFSKVFEGQCLKTNKIYAVKILKDKFKDKQ